MKQLNKKKIAAILAAIAALVAVAQQILDALPGDAAQAPPPAAADAGVQ